MGSSAIQELSAAGAVSGGCARLRGLGAAPTAQGLRGLSVDPKTNAAHALDVAEANLQGNLIERLACVLDTRKRGLATKSLDGTRRGFARFRGELARKLPRAYPRDIRQLLDG